MSTSATRPAPARRRSPSRPDAVDHAYDHCFAVLGDVASAGAAATRALAAGRRSRPSVLAHARHQALAAATTPPSYESSAAEGDTVALGIGTDVVGLARALASTRPPVERVVVDMDSRHDLDRAGLGRALGLAPATAAARAAEVAERWDKELSPPLLAALGPGQCDGLAAVLAHGGLADPTATDVATTTGEVENEPTGATETRTATIDQLLAAGPAVASHLEQCDICQDRVRAMVGVRAVLSQVHTIEAPAAVRGAARMSVARRPAALPPPIDTDERALADAEGSATSARRWVAFLPIGLAGIGFAIAAIALGLIVAHRSGTDKVAALTKVANHPSFASSRAAVGPSGSFDLRNTSGHSVTWRATGSETWLSAEPSSGRLAPGQSVLISVVVAPDAPGGEVAGAVQITGDDGSALAVPVTGQVEQPPSLAAQIDGCTVRARAEDEDGVASVVVHWVDPAERSTPMTLDAGAYVGQIPNAPRPLRWWVSATDGRGNVARTPDRDIPATTC